MTTEQKLREKLRKISALFEGAQTFGERQAAKAALQRVREALAMIERIIREEVFRDIRDAPERAT